MSNKRITDLTELTNPTTDDVFPVVDIATNTTTKVQLGNLPVPSSVTTALATKQDSLVSGTNIKTINSTSVLGSGDVAVQETLVSGTNIKTLNNTSLLGSGNITLTANPSGVSGAIQFSDGSAFASDAANLFWNNTTKRLGIGTATPSAILHVAQAFGASSLTQLDRMGFFVSYSVGAFGLALGGSSTTGGGCVQGTNTAGNAVNKLSLNPFGGNVAVGQVSSGPGLAMLEVRGSGSTSATTSLLVQNSAGTQLFKVADDGTISIGTTITATSTGLQNVGTINNSGAMKFDSGGEIGVIRFQGNQIGMGDNTTGHTSALLTLTSTTKGFLPPRMTTTQKNAIASPAAGLVVYDTTLGKLCVRTASAWETITSL
jgi:hypothetical protein